MSINVFAYGTLQVSEVMEAVTGEKFQSIEAMAHGFVRYTLEEEIYPGMMEGATFSTNGRLYFDVSKPALEYLDQFEDAVYERRLITVYLSSGESREA